MDTPPPIIEILHTDGFQSAWDGRFAIHSTGGLGQHELTLHNNVKELLAIGYIIRCNIHYLVGSHVKVFSGNTTVVIKCRFKDWEYLMHHNPVEGEG